MLLSALTILITKCNLTYLIPRHEGKVYVLQQHWELRTPIPRIGSDPPEHGLVDGTLRGDQQLLAGDEPDELGL